MKTTIFKGIIFGLSVLGLSLSANAEDYVNENSNVSTKKVLVIGLDNVNSNYFPQSMITEETGIPTDSISYTYNKIITNNIIQSNKDKDYTFVSPVVSSEINEIIDDIQLKGEEEERYIDLSSIDNNEYHRLIDASNADYVLFLNQHYLKWQEKPLRTLFHFVSYSLYDKNQKEITKGNNYFTCMNLEKADKLSKASRKSSSKIASTSNNYHIIVMIRSCRDCCMYRIIFLFHTSVQLIVGLFWLGLSNTFATAFFLHSLFGLESKRIIVLLYWHNDIYFSAKVLHFGSLRHTVILFNLIMTYFTGAFGLFYIPLCPVRKIIYNEKNSTYYWRTAFRKKFIRREACTITVANACICGYSPHLG